MMKKMITMLTVLGMVSAMTACGNSSTNKLEHNTTTDEKIKAEQIAHVETKEDNAEKEDAYMETIEGGWNCVESCSLEKNTQATLALQKASESMEGAEYEPVALLAKQIVAGVNYCLLCKVTAVYPGAMPSYALVYVYEDLEGNAEITETKDLTIDPTEGEEINISDDDDNEVVLIPNPWEEYDSAEDAEKATGFSFQIPETIREKNIYLIQAITNLAEVRYGSEDQSIEYRKGTGTEDISGDCNEYAEIQNITIQETDVTLRGENGKIYSAIWKDTEYSYSYYVTNGETLENAQKDIESLISENNK